MKKFAVIDTETTWSDEVMSIGAAIADFEGETPFELTDKYYILTPFKDLGGCIHTPFTQTVSSPILKAQEHRS